MNPDLGNARDAALEATLDPLLEGHGDGADLADPKETELHDAIRLVEAQELQIPAIRPQCRTDRLQDFLDSCFRRLRHAIASRATLPRTEKTYGYFIARGN